jgi:cell division protein FtsW
MQIPALQDDFALAFFLHKHGLLAAMLLWLLQAGLLLGLLHRAACVWQATRTLQDFRRVWHARFYTFVLIGGASFLFGQLLLSWSTNLGILPVMGQPMSFLSAGGSHLFFFLLPLLAFHTLYAPILEETPSCPPMSTTKS